MDIKLHEITIRDLTDGYVNNDEEGVVGYNGKLNIRPKYQRNFIYKDKQRNLVIDTIKKDFPLNVMYWVENEDGSLEVLDGQQRTISICEYVKGNFSLEFQFFHTLTKEEQEQIFDYKLKVYFCKGTDREKLDWFRTINIAGVKLTDQELRNAVYSGSWLTEAKKYFSKSGCPAHDMGSQYLRGSSIRQDYLETVISWISNNNIEQYMTDNREKTNANELWLYFQSVLNWIKAVFPTYRKEMKGVNYGFLYNQFKDIELDTIKISEEVDRLMMDDDVTKRSGIYPYVLTRDEKYLNLRSFTANQKRMAYEKQKGICPKCKKPGTTPVRLDIDEMEADHIKPWHEGGKTVLENCQLLCQHHNRVKSGK